MCAVLHYTCVTLHEIACSPAGVTVAAAQLTAQRKWQRHGNDSYAMVWYGVVWPWRGMVRRGMAWYGTV